MSSPDGRDRERVEALFHDALERPPGERLAFLHDACEGNEALILEVQSLLAHDGQDTERLQAALGPVAADLTAPPLEADPFPHGSLLGPYRIEQKLGEGGMGRVYLATDTRLGRLVAVKVIHQDSARTAESRARFLREARYAAALSHPHIATLHDLGETGGVLWLVMQYVAGGSLRSRLAGPAGESLLLRYAGQMAAALEHAHLKGFVHRDIKPENILFTEDDQLKLIDFGLARAIGQPGDSSQFITEPNRFLGTLAYTAPELLTGGPPSTRSDIYSVGVVLYELACGVPPFQGLTGRALVAAILAGEYARPSALKGRIGALIERCLAADPAARYQDGSELAAVLREWETSTPSGSPAEQPVCLAVLDFVNLAGSTDLDWLGAGIAETLSADLAKLKTTRIVSRSRVAAAAGRLDNTQNEPNSAVALGAELGARWIVSGSYQKMGARLRVTPSLIDAATGDALALPKVDGLWDELFDVQDRVVEAILQPLTIRAGTTDPQRILPPEKRSLMAYEHYVRGRQCMYQMTGGSLSDAIAHFEKAVALDGQYALACSGLGTAHALQFVRTSHPQDAQKAAHHLERAVALDPELGEPYPWLANIRSRQNNLEGAYKAGLLGVERQPDLPEAHYFPAALDYMFPEFRPGQVRRTPDALHKAIRLQPRFHAAWLILGAAELFLGHYEAAARALDEAVRLISEPDLVYRFVGARTLRGFVWTRCGEWEQAKAEHLEAIEELLTTQHVYTPCFLALSACGLGDIELRTGTGHKALAHYRHAWRIVQESPRAVGSARMAIRISAGLAAAYAALGETGRAGELVDESNLQLEQVSGHSSTATIECSLAQLHFVMTVAELRLGRKEEAIQHLVLARERGWMDGHWLTNDPEFKTLQTHPSLQAFVESVSGSETPEAEPLPNQSRVQDSSIPARAMPSHSANRV